MCKNHRRRCWRLSVVPPSPMRALAEGWRLDGDGDGVGGMEGWPQTASGNPGTGTLILIARYLHLPCWNTGSTACPSGRPGRCLNVPVPTLCRCVHTYVRDNSSRTQTLELGMDQLSGPRGGRWFALRREHAHACWAERYPSCSECGECSAVAVAVGGRRNNWARAASL
jgi:hypothetical protein